MRTQFAEQLKIAMKAGDKQRVGALRLIIAALKDKDIEARGLGKTVSDDDVLALLQKMVKSRRESLAIYEGAGREDLAAVERDEIAVINSFLPEAMDDAETGAAIDEAIAETAAAGLKDMGKVIAVLRAKHAGRMDFGKASGVVKRKLG